MKRDSEQEVVIFTEAVKVAPHERKAFLQRHCADDEKLRSRVEALLKAHDRVGDFLEGPPPL